MTTDGAAAAEGVDSTTKIRILKQITTMYANAPSARVVLIPPQRYEF